MNYEVFYDFAAEREGFEPPDPCRSTVFKTAAIDRSAISPWAKLHLFQRMPNFKTPFDGFSGAVSPFRITGLPISLAISTLRRYLCIIII
jgi:hypothetical protein